MRFPLTVAAQFVVECMSQHRKLFLQNLPISPGKTKSNYCPNRFACGELQIFTAHIINIPIARFPVPFFFRMITKDLPGEQRAICVGPNDLWISRLRSPSFYSERKRVFDADKVTARGSLDIRASSGAITSLHDSRKIYFRKYSSWYFFVFCCGTRAYRYVRFIVHSRALISTEPNILCTL